MAESQISQPQSPDSHLIEPQGRSIAEIPVGTVAVIHSQDDLDQVLEAHGQWVKGVFDPETLIPSGRAHLKSLDLTPFCLTYRDLSGADLTGANLQEMDLTGINLTAANLTRAVLACANLQGAKLRGAKFEGTDLRGANLTGVSMSGVDLSKAILKSTEPDDCTLILNTQTSITKLIPTDQESPTSSDNP